MFIWTRVYFNKFNNFFYNMVNYSITTSQFLHPLFIYWSVALGHRNKIVRGKAAAQDKSISSVKDEPINTPDEFLCPITHEIMTDPVIAAGTGRMFHLCLLLYIGNISILKTLFITYLHHWRNIYAYITIYFSTRWLHLQ